MGQMEPRMDIPLRMERFLLLGFITDILDRYTKYYSIFSNKQSTGNVLHDIYLFLYISFVNKYDLT